MKGPSEYRDALLAQNLPDGLARVIRGGEVSFDDARRGIVDLLYAPPGDLELFDKLRHYAPMLDSMYAYAKALKSLHSSTGFERLIVGEVVEGQDPFLLLSKIDLPGAGFKNLYTLLYKEAANAERPPNQHEDLTSKLGFFEETALSLILDQDRFFTKTKCGNKGTISEYLGRMVLFSIPSHQSPLAQAGRYVERVAAAVRHNDIVAGRITSEDPLTLDHQIAVLSLLYRVQTQDTKMPEAYWSAVEANPHFARLCHEIALKEHSEAAGRLLIQSLRHEYTKAKGDLSDFKSNVFWFLNNHFREQDAFHRFLEDPVNQYKQHQHRISWGAKQNTSRLPPALAAPDVFAFLPGPRVLVLLSQEIKEATIEIAYADITDRVDTRTASLADLKDCQDEASAALINLAQGFAYFQGAYVRALENIDASSFPSKATHPSQPL